MLKKVKEAIFRFDLLQDKKHITVALSGGADSMALLYALIELKNELNISKISAAHFNHMIRGDESLRDQNFVVKKCSDLGVELFLGSADVLKFANENQISVEFAARKLRYEFFNTLNTDAVATAHTASDNIETVILNLTRGTGLSGLCGIPVKRDIYIRPLIFCTRDDVENFCTQNGVEYVTDSTNLCDDYTRNNIRHNVVPVLKSFNQSLEATVGRMTTSLREDQDFIDNIVTKEYETLFTDNSLLVNTFNDLHITLAKRIIAKYCENMGVEVDNFHINQIYEICKCGGKISLAGNNSACVKNGILKIISNKTLPNNMSFKVDITQSDNNIFTNNIKIHNLLLKNILDCDKIVGQLVLRQRTPGDTVRLKNKNCTKTLKKLFCEYKIPVEQRDVWPVLSDDDGIVWIHQIGVADRCAADQNSKKIFKINVNNSF